MKRQWRFALVLAAVAVAVTTIPAAGSEQAFLVLKSKDFADTEATIAALEAAGAHVAHVMPPRALIACVPPEAESQVLAMPNVEALHRDAVPSLEAAEDQDLAAGASAWNYLIAPRPQVSEPQGQPLVGDALLPPVPPGAAAPPALTAAPGTYQTSEFMIGKVAVGVILPESNGGSENWDSFRQTQVFNEIVAGLNWWITRGGAAAHLTFYYDQRFSVPTQYEPITRNGIGDEDTWVTDIFQNMGYTSGSRFTRAYAYINSLRSSLHTDWCYAFIVVDSLNDPDGTFTGGYFGWAYLGGPYVIMTYDNDNWGIGNMDMVASHETGHIFLAGDEYCQPGYACCDFGYYGYLNIYNGNCENGNPSSVPCRMRYNENAICQYTNGQIGWRDTDSDGRPDPTDNVVSNTLNTPQVPTGPGAVVCTGLAVDVPYDSSTRTDVTINKISAVKFRVDGGSWADASATDGAFDEDTEDYTFTTAPLGMGTHLIEAQAFSTSGNSSSIASRNVEIATPAYFLLPAASEWIDPSGHTSISLSDDGVSSANTIPFTFELYGSNYTQVFVGANGLSGFVNSGLDAYTNTDIPNASTPNAVVYPYWDDLNPGAGGSARIGTAGTAPHRKLVISWVGVPHFAQTLPLTFQTVLCEGSSDVIFQYLEVQPGDPSTGAGRSATVGIEDGTGAKATKYSYNGSSLLSNNQALLFTHKMPISDVKGKAHGTAVALRQNVVTCAAADWFYMEDTSRISGIRVQKTAHGLTAGMKALVVGTIQTDSNGERCVLASTAANDGSGSVGPVALNGRSIGGGNWQYDAGTGKGQKGVAGGAGLTNIGLLVTGFGAVTEIEQASPATWFVIDDGSGVNVKCLVPSGVTIAPAWQYVSVTGISSCEKVGQELHRLLRVRQQSDIVAVQ